MQPLHTLYSTLSYTDPSHAGLVHERAGSGIYCSSSAQTVQGRFCWGCASRLLHCCVQAAQYAEGLQKLIPQLGYLAKILPPAVLQWKLELLKQGNQVVKPLLTKIQQRVFLLTADNDFLIPSKQEGPRLKKLLPRCRHEVRASVAVSCMLGLTANWMFLLAASLVPFMVTHMRRLQSNCMVTSVQS